MGILIVICIIWTIVGLFCTEIYFEKAQRIKKQWKAILWASLFGPVGWFFGIIFLILAINDKYNFFSKIGDWFEK